MSAAERLAQQAKRKAKEAQEEAILVLGVRQRIELTEEMRREFESLPNTLAEIEDAIGSANARLQLMGRADEQVFFFHFCSKIHRLA